MRISDAPGRSAALRSRRGLQALLVATAAALLLGGAGGVWFVSSPGMCASCHHTRPSVVTWRHSAHRRVHCLQCHAGIEVPPDPLGRARASWEVARQFAARAVRQEQTLAGDGLCTRAGCHDAMPRDTKSENRSFAFDHTRHLETERETVELTCVSCHPKSAHSPAPGPARETCTLCHRRHMIDSSAPDKCYDCHPQPIATGKGDLHHDRLGPAGDDCLLCHGTVYSGTMEAPRERCLQHMTAQDYDQTVALPALLHYTTVTERGVACFECHRRPRHESGRQPVPRTVEEAQQGG